MDLAAWLDKLNDSSLPALQASRDRLIALCSDENASTSQVVNTIERDLGLTVRLLRYISRLNLKHLKSEVTTVNHGQMMLGLNHLRQLPEGLPAVEELEPGARQRLLENFSHSYHAAYQSYAIARQRADLQADEMFMAALLHDLGRILLCLHAPDKMAELDLLISQQEKEPDEAEYVVFGFTIDDLTHALVEAWGLPSLLADSLSADNAGNNRVYGIMLASQLAHAARRGWWRTETYELIEQLADHLMMSVEETTAFVHSNAAEAARHTAFYGVRPAAVELLDTHPKVEDGMLQESSQDDSAMASNDAVHDTSLCLLPQLPLAARRLRELANRMDGSLTLSQALKLSMEALHEGLGLNRVVFCLLSRDKSQLTARSVLGGEHDPHFSRFHIDLYTSRLFRLLMEKPQSLWLGDNNREKYRQMLPPSFFDMTGCDSCYLMSVVVKGKPVGLFYADRGCRGCSLDEDTYRHFKKVVLQTSQTLGYLHNSRL